MTAVVLHLGAHRTGSSYLQTSFVENQHIFDSFDIGFQYFHLVPGLREAGVKARQAAQASNKDKFEKHFKKIDSFLIKRIAANRNIEFMSYEGLLGPIDISQSKLIYPHAEVMSQRIVQTISRLTDKPTQIMFCIRDTSSFVESTYLYCARGGTQYSFNKYISSIDLKNLSWVPVLQSLCQVFGPKNVITWSHEKFRLDKSRILEWAFKETAIGSEVFHRLRLPDSSVNSSITARSLSVAETINQIVRECNETKDLSRSNKRKLAGRLNRAINRQLADTPDERPCLLSTQQKEHLSHNYASDIEWIKKNMPEQSIV